MISIKTADGEVVVSGTDFKIEYKKTDGAPLDPPPILKRRRVRRAVVEEDDDDDEPNQSEGKRRSKRLKPNIRGESSDSDEEELDAEAVWESLRPGRVAKVLLQDEPQAWLLITSLHEHGCFGVWFWNHDDPHNPVTDGRSLVLQLGEPELVEKESCEGAAVDLKDWLEELSKAKLGVHPYAYDGTQTPFFGVDVATWIFGWCAAADLCGAPGTLQERLQDMTCGALLQRFKSTASALSTCGTPDVGRSKEVRSLLASGGKVERLGGAGAGLSDGVCWACQRKRRLAFTIRGGAGGHAVHRIGCQCAAQLGRLKDLYARLTEVLTRPMPTTAEALEKARQSLAEF